MAHDRQMAKSYFSIKLSLSNRLFSVLYAGRHGWIPPLDPWAIQLAMFVFLVCGCLSLASVLLVTTRLLYDLLELLVIWIGRRR